ncbi:electron transfer flavoprotein subunit alpha/FixB family protein [Methylophaga sp. OBS4]|uniref:electron transfer flavoprotein subunit alpha/FixB family protein n=1 Tax=Methylophaga sp. OBS4 TaxID=2991935 RepID=UPI0022515491|nr:electron transfer flavoprotein subunit alpha/FixB family protein [Methylophaga sp. OBS4]MCX4187076.1 electron transfer flavoprotein subunit alpha/FixB family protein [Methylophaga sp. OBS4]
MKTILVVAESRQNELRPISLEVITAAQDIRQADDKVVVAIIGQNSESYVDQLSLSGVDEVVAVKTPSEDFDSDIHEAAVSSLMETYTPAVVLMPHSVDSLGYAPTLARKGNYGFASDVFGLTYDGDELVVTRAAYNEKVYVEVDFPGKDCVLLTVRASVFKPVEEAATPTVNILEMNNLSSRSQNLRYVEPEGAGDIDITTVDFIMSIGRGIADEDNVDQFRELADMAGATLCCSRPIADSGWLPKSRQVGQSGKVVGSCKLYVAMGISGSIQHMAGMKHVPTIVAVNTDPGASIFTIAKYGIVGDIFDIEEELRTHFE